MILGDLAIILVSVILILISLYMRDNEKPIAKDSVIPLSINITIIIGAVGILVGLIRLIIHL